ncbi:hypothetical protein [Robbsia sp. KACC 23696]|uniref:hypothetical protein n=1 Tax=Robbsia sp. KACC 23696 TaxID=3149231 RepID=UPI00325BA981
METASSTDGVPAVFSAAPVRSKVKWWLIALLPMFGQTFHYLTALLPLWALSKAFPVLSLPLVLLLRGHVRLPVTRQILISLTWLVLFPSFAAIFYFNESFFTSLTAQVKLLPILYFFSFLAVLFTLKPTLAELEKSFLLCGIIVVAALILMSIVVPNSWYSTKYVVGQADFFSDDGRGHRIRMPMYFPMVLLFFCYRRTFFERSFRYLVGTVIVFCVALLIVKARSGIIGITAVILLNSFRWARMSHRIALMVCAPFALVGMFSTGYLATAFSTDAASGFDTRRVTIELASQFLGKDPLRWIFGVGTISPTSKQSLMDYFHHFFFLADITWLGIVFEYGLIGAFIIVLFQVRGLLLYRRLQAKVEDDFLGALCDYLIYILFISFFYPPTLVPGETAVILAIFVYIWRAGELEEWGGRAAPYGAVGGMNVGGVHARLEAS